MTTLEIRNSIDTNLINEELKSNKYYGAFTYNQLFNIEVETKIQMLFEDNSKAESGLTKSGKNYINYKINNVEVLNVLRTLYINTKSSYVKNIIKTVGVEKKFTEKQVEVIAKEASKFDLNYNF